MGVEGEGEVEDQRGNPGEGGRWLMVAVSPLISYIFHALLGPLGLAMIHFLAHILAETKAYSIDKEDMV